MMSAADALLSAGDSAGGFAQCERASVLLRRTRFWKPEVLVWWGFAQSQLAKQDFAGSLDSCARARRALADHGGAPLVEAAIRETEATLAFQLGKLAEAYALESQVLEAREGCCADSLWTAVGFNALGLFAWRQGRYADAEQSLTRALAIEEVHGRQGAAYVTMLSNFSALSAEHGDLATAERMGRRALEIQERRDPMSLETAQTVLNLAIVYAQRGDLATADALNARGLRIYDLKDPQSVDRGTILMNLGIDAQLRGDLDSAQHLLRQADDIFRGVQTAEAQDWRPRNLINLSNVAMARGDFAGAVEYARQSVDQWKRLDARGTPYALALCSLGGALAKQQKNSDAKEVYRQALEVLQPSASRSFDAADVHLALGEIALEEGQVAEAEAEFEQALEIRQELTPDATQTAEILHSLAVVRLRRGERSQALALNLRALDTLERQSNRLGGGPDAKPGFLEQFRFYYADAVATLADSQRGAEAFAVLERSRARGLLDLLAERDLESSRDLPVAIDQKRRKIDLDYDAAQAALASAVSSPDKSSAESILASLNQLRREREAIALEIRKSSPRYANLLYPQPFGLEAARKSLDPRTLLLSYSVGKDRSYLFVVEPEATSGSGLHVFPLPSGDRQLRSDVEAFRNLRELDLRRSNAEQLVGRGRSLYEALLGPASSLIAKYDRLLILPEGPLYTIPWAALVREVKNGQPHYLVEWKPIHTAVSATVYAELETPRRQNDIASVEVAAFGDPKYPTLNEKKAAVKRSENDEITSVDPLANEFSELDDPQLRSVARGGFRFAPLPASRKEVEEIASLYAPKSVAFLGSDATEERAKSIGKEVPIIHFATHAVINERFPLDSALVFTIPEHPKEGQDNGLLQAWEIFESMRIDADLVTLSACDSGLGKEMGGEGLIGLTRAFQYAGARSVLASLWRVEDKATAELMRRFYTYLKSGMTKDEALRHAQIDLIHSKDYSNPRDWAAFQLNGDWK